MLILHWFIRCHKPRWSAYKVWERITPQNTAVYMHCSKRKELCKQTSHRAPLSWHVMVIGPMHPATVHGKLCPQKPLSLSHCTFSRTILPRDYDFESALKQENRGFWWQRIPGQGTGLSFLWHAKGELPYDCFSLMYVWLSTVATSASCKRNI